MQEMRKKTVAAYVRVSTQEQAKEGYSIGEQIERLTKYCEAMNWKLYKVYTDAGFSGASTNRPGLQEMITDIKAGKIDNVVVYKLDRLSRSQLDTLYLIEKVFLANGCDFVSMNENFDTATPFGRAMIGILAVFAQLEREQIKERMTMGKEARAKEGKWAGGKLPYGYDNYNGELVINEYEAMIVKELFAEFTSGTPLFRIQENFAEKGYKLRNKNFALHAIKYMLENKIYAGYVRYKDEWIKAIHEPIIDLETIEKSCEMLEANRQRFIDSGVPVGGKTRSTYLGGLMVCAHCGGKFGKRLSGRPTNRYYTYVCYSRQKRCKHLIKDPNCKNKIYKMTELDDIIFNEIKKLAFDPDYFYTIKQENTNEENNKKIHLLEMEIKKIDEQISRFMDLYGLGRFTVDQLDAKLIPLEEQRNRLQDELKAIQNDKSGLAEEEAITVINSFSDILEKGDFHEIRGVIETLIDNVEIDNDNITIHWRFL